MRYFLLILFTLSFSTVLAQEAMSFEHLTNEDGLTNNSIRVMFQDREGYMWFGTLNGLSRYNGRNFETIDYNGYNSYNNKIRNIYQDQLGYIWILPYGEMAHCFNPKTETFLNIPAEFADSLQNKEVKSIFESSQGVIWLNIQENGCARVIYSPQKTDHKINLFNTKNLLPSNSVNFISKGKKKGIWIGTKEGLCFFPNDRLSVTDSVKRQKYLYAPSTNVLKLYESDSAVWAGTDDGKLFRIKNGQEKLIWQTPNRQPGKDQISFIDKSTTGLLCVCSSNGLLLINEKSGEKHYYSKQNSNLNSNYILSCFHDKHDDFWLVTDKRGITRFQIKEREFTYYPLNPSIRQSILEGEKQQFCEDKNGDLWIGIYGGGISKFNRKERHFDQFLYDENNRGSLSSNLILSLYCDLSGNIWAGTYKRGINRINLHHSNFHSLQLDNSSPKDFSNEVRAIFKDSRKWIWTGNKRGDIVIFNSKMQKLFALNDFFKSFKITCGIYAFEEDNKNRIWIGTKGQGIYIIENFPKNASRFSTAHLKVTHLEKSAKNNNSLSHNDVFDLQKDKNGQMWVALYHGGVNVIQNPLQHNQHILRYLQNPNNAYSISDNRVRCIKEDKAGNIWIGTAKGLNFLSSKYKTTKNKRFITIKNKNNGFENYDIICLLAEKNKMWIGTYGEGAFSLSKSFPDSPGNNGNANICDNAKESESWKITPVNGLSNNLVFSFVKDNNRAIWIGTDLGLNKLYPQTGKVEKYYKTGGLQENSFSEGDAIKADNGNLLFGNISGMVWFSPDSIHKSKQVVPVVLTRLMINGENNKKKLTQARQVIKGRKKELRFSHNENFLSFEFVALDYKAPRKIQYMFKLEGYEQEWNTEGNLNTAIYRGLHPGTYLFRMKASNSEGMWVNPEKRLKIVISPAPWQTLWAYLLYLIVSLTIFIFARRFFLERLRLKHEVVFEKQLVDEKIKFYTSTSHEFKTPLALIYGLVEDLLNSPKISEEIKSSLYTVKKNTNRLLELINQLMDFRKIQKGVFNIQKQQGNPVAFLNEIYQAFLPLAQRMKIKFSYQHTNACTNAFTDYKALEKIIFNLLSNAFKHTESQKTIDLILANDTNTGELSVTVKDQGEGIGEEDLPLIFERFSLGKSQWKEESSSGIGLSLCKEITELLGGTISVVSQIGIGSCFTVILPDCRKNPGQKEITDITYDLKYTNRFVKGIEKKQPEIQKTSCTKKAETILIVEDNSDLQSYLNKHLSEHYNVLHAFNGKEGLKIAQNENPDLIICDIMMPKMDGLEMTSILKNEFRTSHIPIVLLTAKSMDIHKIEGIETGADDYITKPFNIEYLQKRIKNILMQRKQLKERFSYNPQSKPAELVSSEKDEAFLSKVISLTEKNMRDPNFSVDTLISHFNFGRTVFYKKMKGISGYAPNDFIRIIRMKKAGNLFIENPDLTVTEIAFMVGYDELAYFSKIFKKHFGETPSEYKRKHKQH